MERIHGLVRSLREGNDAGKEYAARALCIQAFYDDASSVAIAEAGGIAPLVKLLRDGSVAAKTTAACALLYIATINTNKVLIAAAGGVPPLIELVRDGSADAKLSAAAALRNLARNNDANAVEIAEAIGLEALVELARRGRVTVDTAAVDVGIAAKRKAALVVAKLIGDCVPDSVPRVIKAVIGPYL